MGCISDTIDDVGIVRCFACKEYLRLDESQTTLEKDPVCDFCWENYQSECFQDQQAKMKAEGKE